MQLKWIGIAMLGLLVACSSDSGDDDSGGGDDDSNNSSGGSDNSSGSSTTTEKYSCSLNGTCYKCPTSDDVRKCSSQTGPGDCTSTDDSYCER